MFRLFRTVAPKVVKEIERAASTEALKKELLNYSKTIHWEKTDTPACFKSTILGDEVKIHMNADWPLVPPFTAYKIEAGELHTIGDFEDLAHWKIDWHPSITPNP